MDITKDKQPIGQDITLTKTITITPKTTILQIRSDIKDFRSEITERLDYIVSANNLKDIK